MKLVVTIYEQSFEEALRAIRELDADHDMVELRADPFDSVLRSIDLSALRAATSKPLILTCRGRQIDEASIDDAVRAGIDFVDVEYDESASIGRHLDRIVLSHHDFEGVADVEPLLARMLARGCAHTKLAVTPQTMQDNLRLLRAIVAGATIIGMGERGLYSRLLAPFLGSELAFVAAAGSAAPGQIQLHRALEIYGSDREGLHATHVFAIAGDPAGHSLSPSIHNPLFRARGVDAAYTIASFATFREVADAFTAGELRGMSITAPFKEEAMAFARSIGASIGGNAARAGAVNTLVRGRSATIADNTDVDGFAELIGKAESAAIIGAGGTARAALVALDDAGVHDIRVFNRTPRDVGRPVEPLEALASATAELVINTLPGSVPFEVPKGCKTYIAAAYGGGTISPPKTARSYDGLDLLRAQAKRQNELFVEAIT